MATRYKVITAMRNFTIDTMACSEFTRACAQAEKWKQTDSSSRSMIIKYTDDEDPVTFVWDEFSGSFRCIEDVLTIANLASAQAKDQRPRG